MQDTGCILNNTNKCPWLHCRRLDHSATWLVGELSFHVGKWDVLASWHVGDLTYYSGPELFMGPFGVTQPNPLAD